MNRIAPLIMILAGGTGGHIFPGLAVAHALRARGAEVTWLGADGGMETRLVPQHGITIDTIAVKGLRSAHRCACWPRSAPPHACCASASPSR